MALDPNLILRGAQQLAANQPIQSLLGGVQAGQQFRGNLLQQQATEQLMQQRAQAQSREIQQVQIEEGARDAVTALQIKDPARRNAFLQRRVERLTAQGRDPSDTAQLLNLPFDQQDDELRRAASVLAPLSQVGQQVLGGQGRVVGSPRIFERDGQQFFGGVREAPDGSVESFEVPIEGALVAAGGETAITKRTRDLEDKQSELKLEAEAATTKEERKGLGVERAEIAKDIRSGAREGRKVLRETSRLKRALESLQTGRLAAARQALSGLIPGIGDADATAFTSMVNQFVLSRKDDLLGGGILSDTDIALLQQVGPQLGVSNEANLKIIEAFEAVANSSIDRAKRFNQFKAQGGNIEDFEIDVESVAQPTTQPVTRIRFDAQGNIIP